MRTILRRRAAAAAVVLAAAAALALSAATAGAQPAAQSAKAINTITIGIAGIPPYWYGFRTYLAADKAFNFYRKAGVNVEIKPFATGEDAVRAVVAGQIDASWSDSGLGMTLISKGVPLVGIEGMDKVDYVLATRDGDIRRCADVKGQTIVVEAIGSSRYHALQSMLTACNLTVDDVKVVPISSGQLQAVLSGQVKAGVFHLNDIAQAKDLRKPLRILVRIGDTDPNLSYDILWVRKDTLAKKRNDFIRVIKGDILASRYMYNKRNFNRVSKFTKVTGASPRVGRFSLQEFLKLEYWPLNRSGIGKKSINHTVAENVKLGNIDAEDRPGYREVVDTSLWNAAWKQMKPKKKAVAAKKHAKKG